MAERRRLKRDLDLPMKEAYGNLIRDLLVKAAEGK
jgi:hypothetical protein